MAEDESGKGQTVGKHDAEASASTVTIDTMSPYYLCGSDKPGDVLVGTLLRDGNYGDWIDDMTNSLYAKNKIGFVNGDMPMPKLDSPLLPYWQRNNAMVKAWLHSSMEPEIRQSVKFRTAREIWRDLEERFGKESVPCTYELRRKLSTIRQEGATVFAYFSSLRRIWDEMSALSPPLHCNCGHCTCDLTKSLSTARDRDQLYDFLMGLDDTFSPIRTQILGARPVPTLSTAYHLVSEDEQHRSITAARKLNGEAAAFQTQIKKDSDSSRRNSTREPRLCMHCGRTNQTIETCFKIIGYPSNWNVRGKPDRTSGGWDNSSRDDSRQDGRGTAEARRKGDGRSKDGGGRRGQTQAAMVGSDAAVIPGLTNEQLQRLTQYMRNELQFDNKSDGAGASANMAGKLPTSKPWVIDSGATEHITCDKILIDMTPSPSEPRVRIPNGDMIPVTGVGRVHLPNGLHLPRALYIPEFHCNLLSVSRLVKDRNYGLTFFRDFCVLQDLHSRRLIGVGKERDGLYL